MTMMASHAVMSSASMDPPLSQNTAPVLEFRCLYTADLRRKQKRWQDGRLKYHTFNKRVMVYDERSNFVGDTHWKGAELEEGEELELERGGIIVEVQEYTGKREQDLTELVGKRVKDREERVAAKAAASPPAFTARAQSTAMGSELLRHKSLNAVLTPSGHYGRAAALSTSPFEQRQTAKDANEPPVKKRKLDASTSSKNGYAQNLMGATLSLTSSKPPSTPTIRYEPFKTQPAIRQQAKDAIDLTLDDDEERGAADARRKLAREARIAMMEKPRSKPKKHKRSSPAKSGYASNLTGTPLVFTEPAARQYSKTTSVKPLYQAKCHESAESPSESDDSAVEVESHPNQPAYDAKKQRTTAVQARYQKSDSSINEASGGLEGINLHSERVSKEPTKRQKRRISRPIDLEAESWPTEEDAFVDTSPTPLPLSTEAARRNEASTKIKEPSKPETVSHSRSTSPPGSRIATPVLQQRGSSSRSMIHNPVSVEPMSSRPQSGLRIKSRAPRKMLMLLDRSNSHPSLPSGSLRGNPETPRSLQGQNSSTNDVVLSQATMDLNDYCRKQEALLQARLNGIRPRAELDNMPSPIMVNDIQHQTIDLTISQRAAPVPNRSGSDQELQSETQSCPITELHPQSARIEQMIPAADTSSRATNYESFDLSEVSFRENSQPLPKPTEQCILSCALTKQHDKPPIISPLAGWKPDTLSKSHFLLTNPISALNDRGQPRSFSMNKPEHDMTAFKESDTLGSMKADPLTTALKKPADQMLVAVEAHGTRPEGPKPVDFQSLLESGMDSSKLPAETFGNQQTEAVKVSKSKVMATKSSAPDHNKVMSSLRNSLPSPEHEICPSSFGLPTHVTTKPCRLSSSSGAGNSLPEHMHTVIQSATAHFRAMISPKVSAAQGNSPPTDLGIHRLMNSIGSDSTSKQLAVKVAPVRYPPVEQASDVAALGHRSGPGFDSKTGPPRARLANPATRGKSLQTLAANAVDTMSTLFNNPMPPPAPGPSNRAEWNRVLTREVATRDGAVAGQVRESPLREASVSGPWSREAFDLFGIHGPPQ